MYSKAINTAAERPENKKRRYGKPIRHTSQTDTKFKIQMREIMLHTDIYNKNISYT